MNLKSIFAKVLPTVAAMVIPGSPVAVMGVSAIARALGLDKIDPTPDALDAAITAAQSKNPEILLELKKADAELQKRLAEMGFDSEEKILALQNADRADARAREVAVKDKLPAILAVGVTAFLFAIVLVIRAYGVPDSAHDTILQLVEAIKIAWIAIISYYFGSSTGSKAHGEAVAKLALGETQK